MKIPLRGSRLFLQSPGPLSGLPTKRRQLLRADPTPSCCSFNLSSEVVLHKDQENHLERLSDHHCTHAPTPWLSFLLWKGQLTPREVEAGEALQEEVGIYVGLFPYMKAPFSLASTALSQSLGTPSTSMHLPPPQSLESHKAPNAIQEPCSAA